MNSEKLIEIWGRSKMLSLSREVGTIGLPMIQGEHSMIKFNLKTMEGLSGSFLEIARKMVSHLKVREGTAYFTVHGKKLRKGQALRRGGAHIDGNYEPHVMSFGGGGWKIGEEGRPVGHPIHERQFTKPTGGIILASNYRACNGWNGEFDGIPEKGGDCTHFDLPEPFELSEDTIYYGNNHFIHESLPMADDVHRVFARVTLPEDHEYEE